MVEAAGGPSYYLALVSACGLVCTYPDSPMYLSKQTHYAIQILVHCARAGDARVTAADIARRQRITDFNVAKVVPLLVRAGFVKTIRGRSGGLTLARPASEIRIGDVVRITESAKLRSAGKGRKGARTKASAPPIGQVVGDALDAFVSVLDQHTIADLAGAKKADGPSKLPSRRNSSGRRSQRTRRGADLVRA